MAYKTYKLQSHPYPDLNMKTSTTSQTSETVDLVDLELGEPGGTDENNDDDILPDDELLEDDGDDCDPQDVEEDVEEGISDKLKRRKTDAGFWFGFKLFFSSLHAAMSNSNVWSWYMKFLCLTILPIGILLYILIIFLMVLTFYVFAYAPGFFFTMLSMVGLWSLKLSRLVRPRFTARMFLSGLRSYDIPLSEQCTDVVLRRKSMNTKLNNIFDKIRMALKTSIPFITRSIICQLLSLIPWVGSVAAFILQMLLTTGAFSRSLTRVYLGDIRGVRLTKRRQFMRDYYWAAYGFSLPLAFLAAIPGWGPFLLLPFGQAASAGLYYKAIRPHTIIEDTEALERIGKEVEAIKAKKAAKRAEKQAKKETKKMKRSAKNLKS